MTDTPKAPDTPNQTNKLKMSPELAAVNGYNAYAQSVSGARQQMLGGNLTQNNVIHKPGRKRQRGGLENEFSKGCWFLEFEANSIIIERIPRFTSRQYGDNFDLNPLDIVIFERADDNKLDYLALPKYHSMHQQYGFSYTYDDDVSTRIQKGQRIKAGTKVARSPGVTEDGDWMAGRPLNVAVVTHAAGIEDGIAVRETAADWLRARGIERRKGACGRRYYPCNLYGKKGEYKIFPDIGEVVDTNGLLFSTRPFNETLDPIYMMENRLKNPIYNVDRTIFCQPQARSDTTTIEPRLAKVIDIKVMHNDHAKSNVPMFMTEQLRKYWEADRKFYLKIIKTCLGREGIHGWENLKHRLTPRLNQLVTHGIGIAGDLLIEEGLWSAKDRKDLNLPKTYRGEPLDEWEWEIVFEYLSPIGVGPKLTDLSGGKGVITRVMKDEDMFRDEHGNIADIAFIPTSTVNRMNPGRTHEQLVGAATRDVIRQVRKDFGLGGHAVYEYDHVRKIVGAAPLAQARKTFDWLFGCYEIVCPNIFAQKQTMLDDPNGWWLDHLAEVIVDGNEPYGLYIQNEIGSIVDYGAMMHALINSEYAPKTSPVTYRDLGGKMRTTKANVLIGPMYMLALEKTATDYNGVSISRVNHFGVGTRLSSADKHLAPVREVGSNHSGESENRNMTKSVGGEVVALLADMNNDPASAKDVGTRILLHETPSNIDQLIFPSETRGKHRARSFAINRLSAAGKHLVRPKE